jgi:hypothetical protein
MTLTDEQLKIVNRIVDKTTCDPPNELLRVQYIAELCFAAGAASVPREPTQAMTKACCDVAQKIVETRPRPMGHEIAAMYWQAMHDAATGVTK